VIKEEYNGNLRMFGDVLEIGNGLALMAVAVYNHPWIKLVILDLNTFRPKGVIEYSEMQILHFTEGKALQIRYKESATRADLREDEDHVEKLPWKKMDVMKDGVLNPELIDESLFQISVPVEP
jgi:hypothetical protein